MNKEDIKQFLKPNKIILIIFIILILLSIFLSFSSPFIAGGYEIHRNTLLLPFSSQFAYCQGGCSMSFACPELMDLCKIDSLANHITIEPFFFLLNIIYWYLISCLINSLLIKIKNNKSKKN